MLTVLKLGGELLEDAGAMARMSAAIQSLSARQSVVVVHGGGRAIDADLRARGLEPRFIDGLRITDAAALESVVAVLAGRTNTALVGALHAAGVSAVGLTGADAGVGRAQLAPRFTATTGDEVDLGRVGVPHNGSTALLRDLVALRYVPIIASIGVDGQGQLLNVNADTFAGHLAAALAADRLVIAGATAGVLDETGSTIASLDEAAIERMVGTGTAHSGMIAKLAACRVALDGGVASVSVVGARGLTDFTQAQGTTIVRTHTAMGAR